MSNLSEGPRAESNESQAEQGRGVTGWGLLLAEDEAHGDRRAGRKSGDEWLASSDPATAMRDGSSWSSAGGIGKSSPIGVGALPFGGVAGVDSWPRL